MRNILWLQDITPADRARVGGKAFNLAEVKRAGFPVPDAFCITVEAYADFVAANGLEEAIGSLQGTPDQDLPAALSRLQVAIRAGQIAPQLRDAILSAYCELIARWRAVQPSVAVRSSATAEDLPAASFAGQQSTLLNVRDDRQLLQSIADCWASLWSVQAVQYRAKRGMSQVPAMAVLVQPMVDAEAAGVAFSQDPLTGEPLVVIEAALGLGEMVVSGGSDVDRYTVSRDSGQEAGSPVVAHKQHRWDMASGGGLRRIRVPPGERDVRVLTAEQAQQIAGAALALEKAFGCPQDVEWAWADKRLYILQSRPVTAGVDRFFTTFVPEEDSLWTSGFLNERFPLPVSPLGWTIINELLERLAFRDPLRYLGLKDVEGLCITRLYRGHPYVNLFVFQTLYRVFPDWLLPEDACRYFPSANTALRHAVSYPHSLLDPRFLFSMAAHFLRHAALWSPWHNYRVWAAFAVEHTRLGQRLEAQYKRFRTAGYTAREVWAVIGEAQNLNARLLSVHRWSLTCADLTYSLLRRMVRAWVKRPDATELCARTVAGLPNKSVETDRALRALAQQRGNAPAFDEALRAFLAQYGHRSFYLDIYHPSFADEPDQVLGLLLPLSSPLRAPVDEGASLREGAQRALHHDVGQGIWGWLKRPLFDHLVHLTQRYVPLREDQRFYWQRTLALQRKLLLLLGRDMSRSGVLRDEEHVFFLTLNQVRAYVEGQASGWQDSCADLAAARQREFARLYQESAAAPERAYPPFLRGNQPLALPQVDSQTTFRGRAVSPGLARGRVVVLHSPDEFGKVMPGDVLVAAGVDPGWTVVFGLLSALVLEHGGQLSHAAVVAREYGLPAVAGIHGIIGLLHDGDEVLVDGLSGCVTRVS